MNNYPKALVIIEGAKTESRFFSQIKELFSINLDLVVFGTNVLILYKKIKELDFDCDLKQVLIEMHPDQKELLSQKFAFTYLIFDCDIHHTMIKDEKTTIDERAILNINHIKEMLEYFTDETDPSRGKLYINYPMMESYRDCDDFFDVCYKDNFISIDEIQNYKCLVSSKKKSSFRIDEYTKENFVQLMKMNLFKLNYIVNNLFSGIFYDDYLNITKENKLLSRQHELIVDKRIMGVINTSLFMIVDYYGKKFYNNIIS